MQIYLFRHGETEWNKIRRLQGQSDIPLNDAGREAAVQTSRALLQVPFDQAFCSPLMRTRETAQILLGGRKIPLETDDRLKEMCFGCLEGDVFDTAKQQEAGNPLYDFFHRPERYQPSLGGESFQQVMDRGREFLFEKVAPLEGSCENVLIVAHGALNRGILCGIGELTLKDFWKLSLPNCSAVILRLEGGSFRVVEAGRTYYSHP